MKKHNMLVTVNGVSKSRAQWAKELGVTKGAISLRESKGESASSAISGILGTVHTRKILEHYAHAKEKHPYFCDKIAPVNLDQEDKEGLADYRRSVKMSLSNMRSYIKALIKEGELDWNGLVLCELWEVDEAIANGDTTQAVEECYDAIAVCLRTIDVLEGRQKLGKPETKGEKKVNCVKCGESIPISKAEDWEVSGSTRRYICPSCAAEEAIAEGEAK